MSKAGRRHIIDIGDQRKTEASTRGDVTAAGAARRSKRVTERRADGRRERRGEEGTRGTPRKGNVLVV